MRKLKQGTVMCARAQKELAEERAAKEKVPPHAIHTPPAPFPLPLTSIIAP